MSKWKGLLAACCLALLASSANAAVLYRGLQHTATGSSVVEAMPDGSLHVSNIGSSGQDGVSISLPGMDGARAALHGSCASTDEGASVSLSYRWRLVSLPTSSRVLQVTCTVGPDELQISSSCSVSGLSTRLRLLRNGALVHEASSFTGSVSVAAFAGGSPCPLPSLGCARDRFNNALVCSVEFPSLQSVTVGGALVVCDAMRLDYLDPDSDDDGVDQDCDLLVSSPPGSSFSSVQLERTDFVSHGQFLSGAGQVVVESPSSSGARRLPVHNLGSSGQDGVDVHRAPGSGGGGGGGTVSLDGGWDLRFSHAANPSSFSSSRVSVHGSVGGTCSSGTCAELGSVALTISGSDFSVTPDFSGMAADGMECVVLDRGVEVFRCSPVLGSSVAVTAPPGGAAQAMVTGSGVKASWNLKENVKAPQGAPSGARPAAADAAGDQHLPLHVTFASSRVFVFGGLQATGDELVCVGMKSSTAGLPPAPLHVSSMELRATCASSSGTCDLELLDVASSSGTRIGPEVEGSTCLSSAHTCVDVPFSLRTEDPSLVRGFSVTFHLSPELASCATGIDEGDYLSSTGQTQMFVLDNGGGSYTVDCSSLGPVCTASGDGRLFTLHLSASSPLASADGAVVVDALTLRDCSNADLPVQPGATGVVHLDFSPPATPTGLAVSQVRSGNDVDGTTALHVSRPAADPTTALALYRKGFGNYPEYDDAPGSGAAPSPPSSRADAVAQGWSVADLDGDGFDEVATRDFLYYVAFAVDECGNESAVSNRTDGTLNYHLGDVSDGLATCSGDNLVFSEDISLLGAHYGASVASGSSFACLDVGPTTDRSVHGRPTTDNKVSFEDFMLFAMNYTAVSTPRFTATPAPSAANAVRLELPALPAPGGTFDAIVQAEGAGDIQGISLRLDFDPAVVEQVRAAGGGLLDAQGLPSLVLSSGPGVVDAALLGTGTGISGAGELVRVTFRVKADGDARLALAGASARDANNQAVSVNGAGVNGFARVGVSAAFPNPFSSATELRFSLREAAPVRLGVYDVAGRRVRTLVHGVQPAGERSVTWDGRDDSGLRLAPGAYAVRFEAAGRSEVRLVRLVR